MNTIRPQSMIVTLYGDYIRHAGGSIWIGSLIRLLGYFGLSQQAVRSTVSRMTRRDMLHIDRIGSRSYYSLTEKMAKTIEEGAARIFHFNEPRHSWDGRWHLITYSVPENEREARDRLRQELSWMGFGMLTSALWISPRNHNAEIEQLAEILGVRSRVETFTAAHDGFSDQRMIVQRCWNLPVINTRYATFIDKYRPAYEDHCRLLAEGGDLEPSQYFVRRFNLIHEYRRFPYIDPELPAELLPPDWRGNEAVNLFRQYHELLADQANAFFYSIYVSPANPRFETRKSRILLPVSTPAP